MKTLKQKDLDELAKEMPIISEREEQIFEAEMNGEMPSGSNTQPYSWEEYQAMVASGTWNGGYVEGYGYIFQDVDITTYDPNNFPSTGVESYDIMYRGGFDIGYKAGKSGKTWDDILVYIGSGLATIASGSELGDVTYDLLYYKQGLLDGLRLGRKHKTN